jgi:hypothetical protein
MVDDASAQLAGGRRSFSAFVLPQHPDQHRPQRPVLLAVDQTLCQSDIDLWQQDGH